MDGGNQRGGVADRNLAAESAQLLLYRPRRQAVKVNYVEHRQGRMHECELPWRIEEDTKGILGALDRVRVR